MFISLIKKYFFFRNASFTLRDISERLRIFFIKNDITYLIAEIRYDVTLISGI